MTQNLLIPSKPAMNAADCTTRSIRLNWQEWLPYLEDSNASEAEKRALIEAI